MNYEQLVSNEYLLNHHLDEDIRIKEWDMINSTTGEYRIWRSDRMSETIVAFPSRAAYMRQWIGCNLWWNFHKKADVFIKKCIRKHRLRKWWPFCPGGWGDELYVYLDIYWHAWYASSFFGLISFYTFANVIMLYPSRHLAWMIHRQYFFHSVPYENWGNLSLISSVTIWYNEPTI